MKNDGWSVEININGELAYYQHLQNDEIDKLMAFVENIKKNMAFEPVEEDTP